MTGEKSSFSVERDLKIHKIMQMVEKKSLSSEPVAFIRQLCKECKTCYNTDLGDINPYMYYVVEHNLPVHIVCFLPKQLLHSLLPEANYIWLWMSVQSLRIIHQWGKKKALAIFRSRLFIQLRSLRDVITKQVINYYACWSLINTYSKLETHSTGKWLVNLIAKGKSNWNMLEQYDSLLLC